MSTVPVKEKVEGWQSIFGRIEGKGDRARARWKVAGLRVGRFEEEGERRERAGGEALPTREWRRAASCSVWAVMETRDCGGAGGPRKAAGRCCGSSFGG
jgi:hypothetical protein